MGFIALKCPSCGADIELDESREYGFCSYCGTKIMQDKKVIELKGEVRVEGVSTVEKLLERAYILVEDRDFTEAEGYFNKALELDPKCAKAYWGKLLCEYKITTVDVAVDLGVDITKSNNYSRAVQFSKGEQKQNYIAYGEKASNIFKQNLMKENEFRKKNTLKYNLLNVFYFAAPVISLVLNLATHKYEFNSIIKFFIFIILLFWIASLFSIKKVGKLLGKMPSKKTGWNALAVLLFILALVFPYKGNSSSETDTTDPVETSVVETVEDTVEE